MRSSERSVSISQLRDTQEEDEISLYKGKLTTKGVVASVAKIKAAFPALPGSFYDALSERIIDNGFCDQRLKDAVNFVIDNCRYPTPTVADFITFNQTVKFKTHDQMCLEALNYPDIWKQWLPVKLPDRPKVVWIHANDIDRYKLQDYLVKKTEERTK